MTGPLGAGHPDAGRPGTGHPGTGHPGTGDLSLARWLPDRAALTPDRVAIDSLTALQRIATVRSFREYVLGLTFHIKLRAMCGMVTSTSKAFFDGDAASDLHASTISDAITLLHYVPVGGELLRGVQVLKMRGSDHDKAVRCFEITDRGMRIEGAFDAITYLR